MQIKFTEQALRLLTVPPSMRDHQWFDANLPGFGLRKFETGRAAYFVKYKIGRQQRKITIAKYIPGILAEMRRKAAEMLAEARQGVDARSAKSSARIWNGTLGDAVELYLEARKLEVTPGWFSELKRFLEQYWASFHHRALGELNRGELIRELDKVAQARGATTADHTRKALSSLFAWAIDRGYATVNPLHRTKRRAKGTGRERVLSMRELITVWRALGNDDYGRIVQLLILTMQRRAEIGDLQFQELDLDRERQINLPSDRTKNGRAHVVPLTASALLVLQHSRRQVNRIFLFGRGVRGFGGWSKAKVRLDIDVRRTLAPDLMALFEQRAGAVTALMCREQADEVAKTLGYKSADALLYSIMPHWTLHDLRRTGTTLMNEFGLAEPHIVEAIINHISGDSKSGVAGIYNRAKYEAQKRAGLDRWAEFLLSAVAAFEETGLAGVDGFERRARAKLEAVG